MTAPASPAAAREATLKPESVLQVAALFLAENGTPELVRELIPGSDIPGVLADVADGMWLLTLGGFDARAFRAALDAGDWPEWAAPEPGGAP